MPIKTGTRQLAKQPKRLGLQPTAKVDPKSKGGPRTMRCTGCGGQAIEHPDGKGGTLLRCKNCNRCFAFQRL